MDIGDDGDGDPASHQESLTLCGRTWTTVVVFKVGEVVVLVTCERVRDSLLLGPDDDDDDDDGCGTAPGFMCKGSLTLSGGTLSTVTVVGTVGRRTYDI